MSRVNNNKFTTYQKQIQILDLKEINKSSYPRLNYLGTQKSHKMNYFLILQFKDNENSTIQNRLMLDLRDLHHIISYYSYYYFALAMNINHYFFCHQMFISRVEWMVMIKDLHQSFHSNSFIQSINQWIEEPFYSSQYY